MTCSVPIRTPRRFLCERLSGFASLVLLHQAVQGGLLRAVTLVVDWGAIRRLRVRQLEDQKRDFWSPHPVTARISAPGRKMFVVARSGGYVRLLTVVASCEYASDRPICRPRASSVKLLSALRRRGSGVPSTRR